MRKVIFLFILLGMWPLSSHAQWGVRGGINYTNATDGTQFHESMLSGHAGITYDKQISNRWYFQPALLFSTWGKNYKFSYNHLYDGHLRMHGFEIPLNLSRRPKKGSTKLHTISELGLYARYALWGNEKVVSTYADFFADMDYIAKHSESPFDRYKRLDIGLNLGMGLQKDNIYGILSYSLALMHMGRATSVNHEAWRISMGYRFKNK